MARIKLFVIAVLLAAGISSCKDDVNDLLTFYITEEVNMEFKTNLVAGTVLPLVPVSVPTNSEDEFKNNNTHADLVKDITLEKIVLTITEPDKQNFTFLESINIFASTNNDDEVLIAYRDNIPESTGDTLHLISTKIKLDKYLKSETYKIRTEAKLDKGLQNMKVRTDLRFKVIADPLK